MNRVDQIHLDMCVRYEHEFVKHSDRVKAYKVVMSTWIQKVVMQILDVCGIEPHVLMKTIVCHKGMKLLVKHNDACGPFEQKFFVHQLDLDVVMELLTELNSVKDQI